MPVNDFGFLQANWSVPTNIKTLITTAANNFNLATHVHDDPMQVAKNRELLANYVPATPLWLNQEHTNQALVAPAANPEHPPTADASISWQSRQVLAVMTADCVPILLTNHSGDFVAAIHAGWRGLNHGIIANTLNLLKTTDTSQICAWIGPAICQKCFEVGAEVKQQFIADDPATELYFTANPSSNTWQANLRGIAEHQLRQFGLVTPNLYNNNLCTKCNPRWFYSYRRAANCGRLAFLIWRE